MKQGLGVYLLTVEKNSVFFKKKWRGKPVGETQLELQILILHSIFTNDILMTVVERCCDGVTS